MGGGGGGGQQNNSQNSSGGAGGGIILIKANTIQTSGTCGSSIRISANGSNATNGGNDGMGGGGAAGSIVIEATTFSITGTCPLLVRANGGDGGDCTDGAAHAGGGGGGQGVVIYSSAQPTTNVTTQANNGAAGQDNSGGAISAGNGSGTNGSGIITASSGPLPVELVNFKGEALENSVLLQWHTASENNNDYFTLEKSTNGVDFKYVAKMKGAGTTHSANEYETVDHQPFQGLSYYRLKQTDFDGKYDYSPLINVLYSNNLDFSFFPNPVKNGEAISFVVTENFGIKLLNVTILDVTGNTVYSETIVNDSQSRKEFTLNTLNISAGVYLLKVQNGTSSQIKKLLVQ